MRSFVNSVALKRSISPKGSGSLERSGPFRRSGFPGLCALRLWAGVLCVSGAFCWAQAGAPAFISPKPPETPDTEVSKVSEVLQRTQPGNPKAPPESEYPPLSIPIVQGYDSFGLTIPDLDDAGKLRSVFAIGAVSRVDDRKVEIRNSFLETYKEDGSPDFSIDLPKATLDRFTRVLVAKVPVTIRREAFEVQGASMEFNTMTREGGLGGPVKMVIYNGLGGDGPKAQEKPGKPQPTSISVDKKNIELPADKAQKAPQK